MAGGDGVVIASVSRATYVETQRGRFALVAPGVPPGPVHLGLDRYCGAVATGASAEIREDRLHVEGWPSIDLGCAATWVGFVPDPCSCRPAALLGALAPLAARSALQEAPYRTRTLAASDALAAGDLDGAVDELAGLGPGLTPAGDDALAGAFLAARLSVGEAIEPFLRAAAHRSQTGPISRSFLGWAAAGQSVAPVHELFRAAGRGDERRARLAVMRIGQLGASSGSDMAFGLMMALKSPALREWGSTLPASSRV